MAINLFQYREENECSTDQHDRSVQAMSRQFNRAAHSYNQAAQLQHRVRLQLLRYLPHRIGATWLDVGCGTGEAGPTLRQLGVQRYIGIDLAEGMLQQANQLHPDIGFWLHADANQLPLADQIADGLFSSLMVQWSKDISHTFKEWQRVLKPHGELFVSTLLPGTMTELSQANHALQRSESINRFASQEQIRHALQQAGFQLVCEHAVSYTEHYTSFSQLLRTLKQIGATHVQDNTHKGLRGRHWFQPLAQHYPRDEQQRYPVSYQVLFIHAQRAPQ